MYCTRSMYLVLANSNAHAAFAAFRFSIAVARESFGGLMSLSYFACFLCAAITFFSALAIFEPSFGA